MVLGNPINVEPGVGSDGCIGAPLAPGVGFDVDLRDLEQRAFARV
jgi:hypothetical protein